MKFNKEKYKNSGRRPASGSESRLRKKRRIEDPSTFQEWAPEDAIPDPQPAEVAPSETPEAEFTQEVTEAPSTSAPPSIEAVLGSSEPTRAPNILDDAGLAIRRMEGCITQADLVRAHTLPVRALTKEIAHNLAKVRLSDVDTFLPLFFPPSLFYVHLISVLLCASELGTRYVETNRDYTQEYKKGQGLALRIVELEAKLEDVKAKAEAARADLAMALSARDEALGRTEGLEAALVVEAGLKQQAMDLATSRGVLLEQLEGRAEEEKAKAIEAFKDGEEAQDWLAETYQEGFEDAKREIQEIYPDLDLSSVSALGASDQEAPAECPGSGGREE